MSRIVQPIRSPGGAGRLDLSNLRALLKDRRLWAQLGVVTAHDSGPHWEKKDGQILVQVQTAPRGLELTCRLGAAFGSLGAGGWRVPAPGTEVAVLVPEGEVDFIPMIVACLDSGAAPERASDTQTLLVAPDAIEVDAPAIRLGGEHADQSEIRGDEYRGAEDTLLTTGTPSLLAAFTALAAVAVGPLSALQPGFSQAVTALTTFQTNAAAANGFKSTVVKVR